MQNLQTLPSGLQVSDSKGVEFLDWGPRELNKRGVLMGSVEGTSQLDHVGTLGEAPLAFARSGVWKQ